VKRLVLVGALIGLTVMACGKSTPASTDPIPSENTTPIVIPVNHTVVLGDKTTWSNLTTEQVKFVEEVTDTIVLEGEKYSVWCDINYRLTYFCIKYNCWDWDSFNKACELSSDSYNK